MKITNINQEDKKLVQTTKTVDWLVNNTHVFVFDPVEFKGYQRDININHCSKIVKFLQNNFYLPNRANKHNRTKYVRTFVTANSKNLNRSFEYSVKQFWNSKSKGPYKWGKLDKSSNTLPWIGFVGYEISYKGETRIRIRSLKKELDKQKKVVSSIITRIRIKNARNNTIYKSALEKLNGMSVGRIKLYNYSICENKICWTDGFQSLNLNKYSKIQLRELDRNKYKFLNILRLRLGEEKIVPKDSENNDEILQIKKPFSYYYQAGEKKMQKD